MIKPILASVLTLSLGWLGFSTTADAAGETSCLPPECVAEGCEIVSSECLPDGTCLIECEGPNGETCSAIVECNENGECELPKCETTECTLEAEAAVATTEAGSSCAPRGCPQSACQGR